MRTPLVLLLWQKVFRAAGEWRQVLRQANFFCGAIARREVVCAAERVYELNARASE
jgi:hypothetical protein